MLGHWAGEWPRSQQKYAVDQLASGTSGRLQGGRVSSGVHVLRLGLGTGSRQHLATPTGLLASSSELLPFHGLGAAPPDLITYLPKATNRSASTHGAAASLQKL